MIEQPTSTIKIDHPTRVLIDVVKKSTAVLRQSVESFKVEPTKEGFLRLVEEAETISSAISKLTTMLPDLASFAAPQAAPDADTSIELIDFTNRINAAAERGLCDLCGGAPTNPNNKQKQGIEL
ncbi:MAG: hypothetical protein ACSHWQ_01310 [Spongiibacteraceae bacterium]